MSRIQNNPGMILLICFLDLYHCLACNVTDLSALESFTRLDNLVLSSLQTATIPSINLTTISVTNVTGWRGVLPFDMDLILTFFLTELHSVVQLPF